MFFIALWCTVGAGVLVLLVAAISHRNNKVCNGYRIDVAGPAGRGFVDKKEVADLLGVAGAGKCQGKPILSFDLRKMESVLGRNAWIRHAQLFFDNNGILRVNVIEREPVARIFTLDGGTWYIDSSGIRLPLSDKLTVKLPVFTGYPAGASALGAGKHGADSALALQVRRLGAYIGKDPFWMAQIAQVNITPERNFEMTPVIGDHLIQFGDGNEYEQKFHRLFIFYKEVLSRTGFNKYSRIDVQYAGQVIGAKKGSEQTKLDSLQGIRNIQQLIRSAQQQLQADTAGRHAIRPLEGNTVTEQTLTNYDLVPEKRSDSLVTGNAGKKASHIKKP